MRRKLLLTVRGSGDDKSKCPGPHTEPQQRQAQLELEPEPELERDDHEHRATCAIETLSTGNQQGSALPPDYTTWIKGAKQDPVCFLHWANVWDKLSLESKRPFSDTEESMKPKRRQARQIKNWLVKNRRQSLVAILALIKVDVLRPQGDQLRYEKCQGQKFARAEWRLLHKLVTIGVSDNRVDVLRYCREMTRTLVFEEFVMPLLSMYLDEDTFATDLVHFLVGKGCRSLLQENERWYEEYKETAQKEAWAHYFKAANTVVEQVKTGDEDSHLNDDGGDHFGRLEKRAEKALGPIDNEQGGDPTGELGIESAMIHSMENAIKTLVIATSTHDGWVQTESARHGRKTKGTDELIGRLFFDGSSANSFTCVMSGEFNESTMKELDDDKYAKPPTLTIDPYFDHLRLDKKNESNFQQFELRGKELGGMNLSLCTHLILFKKGQASFLSNGNTLIKRLQHEEKIRTVVVLVNGTEAELERTVEELKRGHPTPLVVPMIGLGGASHYLGRIKESLACQESSALLGDAIMGNVPAQLYTQVKNIQDDELMCQHYVQKNVKPIDMSNRLSDERLREVVTDALWGTEFGDSDDVILNQWVMIVDKEKRYKHRMQEAVLNYVIIFALTLAMTILGVLDSVECTVYGSADDSSVNLWSDARAKYHIYLIILPAVAGLMLYLQTSRHALLDAAKLRHASGLIQSEIYKLRTGTGDYNSHLRTTDDSGQDSDIFVTNCEQINTICDDVTATVSLRTVFSCCFDVSLVNIFRVVYYILYTCTMRCYIIL